MNIYVGNLSYEVVDSDLETAFAPFGRVKSAKVISDMYTGKSKGFGFVEMESRAHGEAAVAELNGTEIKGRAITVNEARPREERSGGGGNHASAFHPGHQDASRAMLFVVANLSEHG